MALQKYSDTDDKELLQKYYLEGEPVYLGQLLERYTLLLFGVCMKYLKNEEAAKDAVQQVFLKAISELQKYRVEYFKTWIYTIAKNYCLMQLRSKAGQYTVEIKDDLLASESDAAMAKSTFIEKEYHLNKMNAALKQLNPEQRQCIESFYLQKKTYQQIAEESGFSLKQVKSYIQNGKRNLKIWMESEK